MNGPTFTPTGAGPGAGNQLSRRDLIKRAAVIGLATPALGGLLAACGGSDEPAGPGTAPTVTQAPATQSPATGTATASATATSAASPTATATSGSGATQIVIAQASDLEALFPTAYASRASANIMQQVYDRIVERADDMEIVPGLAETWEAVDATTWRFKLRQGVKFHNGKPLAAEDVQLSYKEGLELPAGGTRALGASIQEVQIVDEQTVDVITKYPYAPLLTKLVNLEILNAATYKEVGVEGLSEKPVGTGPFTLKEWKKGERVVLSANPDYWRGAPKLATVVFVPIGENATRIAALESGTVDIASEVPARYHDTAKAGVNVVDAAGTRVFYVGLNVGDPLLSDVRVRQALNYGVDVEEIVTELLDGAAEVLHQPLFKKAFGYSDKIQGYHHDPDKAKQLLAEAGHADGFEMTLDVAPTYQEIAEALAGQLAEIGVQVRVNVMESQALYAKYEPGGSQSYLSSWGISEMDADTLFSTQYLSTRTRPYTTYSRPDLDEIITKAAGEVDVAKRAALYHDALAIAVEDAPWIFLYTPVETYGVRSTVQSWNARSDSRFNLVNVTVASA